MTFKDSLTNTLGNKELFQKSGEMLELGELMVEPIVLQTLETGENCKVIRMDLKHPLDRNSYRSRTLLVRAHEDDFVQQCM